MFGQSIKPNINPDAKELTYKLISDTLVIRSENKISSVVLRSGDFRRYFSSDKKSIKISIKDLPKGRFVVIAVTNRKIITFNLIK